MTTYLWILLLASLVATRAQEFDLFDALDDGDSKPPTKPPPKPAPPKKPSSDGLDLLDAFGDSDEPKKPAVNPPKSDDIEPKKPVVKPPKEGGTDEPKKPAVNPPKSDGDFDLFDALGPDTEPKKPVVKPPKEGGTGGGSFDDKDLFDLGDGESEYKPDGGRSGGRGGDPGHDGGASDQPQDLNQQWLHLIRILADNMPEGLRLWIANFKEVVVTILEQLKGLLNVAEEKTEL